jgi:hypothetical protein
MRVTGLVLAAMLLAGLTQAADRGPSDPVQVHYPRGGCETGVLEIEVFSRSLKRWQPHPAHWRILADTCQQEDAGELLNELRVRCIDLANPGRASPWRIGVQVYQPAEAPGCVALQSDAPALADPRIVLSLPIAGEAVRNLSKTAALVGRVVLDHDIGVLIDTRLVGEQRRSVAHALETWIGSVAPLLGSVRVGLIAFGGPGATEIGQRASASPKLEMSSHAGILYQRLVAIWSAPRVAGLTAALEPILDAYFDADLDANRNGNLNANDDARTATRSLSLVVIVGGEAAFPFGRGPGADPHHRGALLRAVERALELGVSLRIFVLGDDEPGLAELVDRVRESFVRHSAAGGLEVLGHARLLGPALAGEMPTWLRDVRVVNLANGVLAEGLHFARSGLFEGQVALETGRNQLRVRAVLSDGRQLVADFDRSFDASLLRDHLRAQEAERIRQLRAREGLIEIEVEEP